MAAQTLNAESPLLPAAYAYLNFDFNMKMSTCHQQAAPASAIHHQMRHQFNTAARQVTIFLVHLSGVALAVGAQRED